MRPSVRPLGLRAWLLLATVLAGAWCSPAGAAIIEQRSLELQLGDGSYQETEELLVLLDSPSDLDDWSRYYIYVDEHIELKAVLAEVLDASGKVVQKVPRRRFESAASSGGGLYSSGRYLIIPFTQARVGRRLRLRIEMEHRPLFPSALFQLLQGEEQTSLRVAVRGGGPHLRWQLRGDRETFRLKAVDGGLELVAEGLESWEGLVFGPSASAAAPLLLLSWNETSSWAAVGEWYEELTADLPRQDEGLVSLARELTAGLETPRQKIEALSTYVKKKVRYEAVQIGPGRFIPSPAAEVRGRGWGDCKDKSEFLAGLLAGVGVPSHLALVRAGQGERIELELPSPYQFNHAILAVPTSALEAKAGDPVSEDFLFIDPTSEWGKTEWLSSASQGREVLVVDGSRSRLVRTPDQSGKEGSLLVIEGEVDSEGNLAGKATLRYMGARAIPWIVDTGARTRQVTLQDFQRVIHRVMPGTEMVSASWRELPGVVPSFLLEADIRLSGAVRGEPGRRWLRAGGLAPMPAPGLLEERTQPVILRAGSLRTEWRLELPGGWCPPKASEVAIDNEVGSFFRRVSAPEPGVVQVERVVTIVESWVDPTAFSALRELALAETRADRRRVRLRCSENGEEGSTATK